jgi:hypothetical protein
MPALKAREFLFLCEDQALAALPAGFPLPERRVMWTILQLHYGDPTVHFELQPHVGRGVIELGLHLEGPVEANDLWAARLAANAVELMAVLGPGWELEEWTASWRRLHRVFRFTSLTAELAREVAADLTRALVALHPVVRHATTPPPVAAQPKTGDRRSSDWRHRRNRLARR